MNIRGIVPYRPPGFCHAPGWIPKRSPNNALQNLDPLLVSPATIWVLISFFCMIIHFRYSVLWFLKVSGSVLLPMPLYQQKYEVNIKTPPNFRFNNDYRPRTVKLNIKNIKPNWIKYHMTIMKILHTDIKVLHDAKFYICVPTGILVV